MPGEAHLIVAAGLALTATFAVTPWAIALATRAGFHDRPVGYKRHAAPTPYLGGAAVLCGFLLGSLTVGDDLGRLAPIVAGAGALWALGTLDDRRFLRPGLRLLVEGGVAASLWASDLGWQVFQADALNLVLTLVWVIGITNAFNLMDNMDGATATVGAVTGIAIAVMALIQGDAGLAVICAGLAGACLGFLPYNLSGPARIFLGDGGSLPIGFVVASALMALPAGADPGWTLLLAAVLLVGTPVVDTALVLISRRRAGVPMFIGGRDHITHRLATRLGSPRRVAIALGAAQAVLGAVAIGVAELGEGSVLAAWFVWFLATVATVALLETRSWAPVREEIERVTPATAPRPAPRGPRRGSVALVEGGLIVFITAACGLSPFFFGFYDPSVWGPIALVLLGALVGLVLARPIVPRRSAMAAICGLALMWLWSLLSTSWAESAEHAMTDSNRWLLYAVLLSILVLLLRHDGLSRLLIGCATAAVCALAGYLAVVMVFGDGPGLFLGPRLNEPLGYINGEAGYLLLGVWPLLAVAERARRPPASGAALAGASFLFGLVLLTEARAVVPAVLGTAVLLILALPGRGRRLWALLFAGAGVAAATGALVHVYEQANGGAVHGDTLRTAVVRLAICSVVAGAAWGGVRALLASRPEAASPALGRLAVAGALAVLLAGGAVSVATLGDPVGRVRHEAKAFVDLHPSSTRSTRFTSGAGNRYDYWRVAANEFGDQPLRGLGAGNYTLMYFRERRTTEDITQPHSLELQTLAELGLVGGGVLLLFLGGVVAGFWRRARRARENEPDLFLAVAAGGIFFTWLIDTSVDWQHLIPGVTGIALFGAAVLVGPWRSVAGGEGRARRLVAGASILLALLGTVLVGRAALADHYRSDAREAMPENPAKAIRKADDSLSLDDEALPTYYVKAAAYARLNRYSSARATLLEAVSREPHDSVTWALLGDLAVRRGDLRTARREYRQALRLNPRDPYLRQAARGTVPSPQ